MKHVCKNPTYTFKYEDAIVSTLLATTFATVCAQPSVKRDILLRKN